MFTPPKIKNLSWNSEFSWEVSTKNSTSRNQKKKHIHPNQALGSPWPPGRHPQNPDIAWTRGRCVTMFSFMEVVWFFFTHFPGNPRNMVSQKKKILQPSTFRGELFALGRVKIWVSPHETGCQPFIHMLQGSRMKIDSTLSAIWWGSRTQERKPFPKQNTIKEFRHAHSICVYPWILYGILTY